MPLRLQNKLKSEIPEQSAHALLTIFLQNGLAENWTSYIVQQFAIFLTIKGTS